MKLNVFKSTRQDGIMSNNKIYFKCLTTEEINLLYESTLTRFFKRRNISLENVIIVNEKNKKFHQEL